MKKKIFWWYCFSNSWKDAHKLLLQFVSFLSIGQILKFEKFYKRKRELLYLLSLDKTLKLSDRLNYWKKNCNFKDKCINKHWDIENSVRYWKVSEIRSLKVNFWMKIKLLRNIINILWMLHNIQSHWKCLWDIFACNHEIALISTFLLKKLEHSVYVKKNMDNNIWQQFF